MWFGGELFSAPRQLCEAAKGRKSVPHPAVSRRSWSAAKLCGCGEAARLLIRHRRLKLRIPPALPLRPQYYNALTLSAT